MEDFFSFVALPVAPVLKSETGKFFPELVVVIEACCARIEACAINVDKSIVLDVVVVAAFFVVVDPEFFSVVLVLDDVVFVGAVVFTLDKSAVACAISAERSDAVVLAADCDAVFVEVVVVAEFAALFAAAAFDAKTEAWTIIAERCEPAATGVEMVFVGAGVVATG